MRVLKEEDSGERFKKKKSDLAGGRFLEKGVRRFQCTTSDIFHHVTSKCVCYF